jgi:sterol desaturase/sphingolipid hydroxylase (fatty acid hydroxylase superfamily)
VVDLPARALALLPALLAGAFAWTLAEYVLHRVVFHELSHAALGASEHRKHHAEPDWFAPAWQKALAALAATGLVLPAISLAAGPAIGAAFTGGFIAMYLAYEVLHRRCHTHPPRGAYGRWRRRNHFAHHFADPHRAHGVTTPIWDHVFGTTLGVDRIRVPRRLAMRWLVDGEGRLRAPFAPDYELVGRAEAGARDRSDLG